MPKSNLQTKLESVHKNNHGVISPDEAQSLLDALTSAKAALDPKADKETRAAALAKLNKLIA